MEKKIPYKIYLSEEEMPKYWYNVKADMTSKPDPMLNPKTGKPATFEDLQNVFCDEVIRQELNDTDRFIEIPEEKWGCLLVWDFDLLDYDDIWSICKS